MFGFEISTKGLIAILAFIVVGTIVGLYFAFKTNTPTVVAKSNAVATPVPASAPATTSSGPAPVTTAYNGYLNDPNGTTLTQVDPKTCEMAKTVYLANYQEAAKSGMDAWTYYTTIGANKGHKWIGPRCA